MEAGSPYQQVHGSLESPFCKGTMEILQSWLSPSLSGCRWTNPVPFDSSAANPQVTKTSKAQNPV